MFGSDILEVGIGLVFIFLLVSIISSAVREALEAWMKSRAAFLERGIRELLHDIEAAPDGLARAFYTHPLIHSLYASSYSPGRDSAERPRVFTFGGGLPSYIPARNFSLALMDIAARGRITDEISSDPESPALTLESMRQNVLNLGNPAVQRVVLVAIDSAQGDFDKAGKAIEAWFDSGMDRVSGWYKRATYSILLWTGLVVAIALNVDPIAIARYLYRNDAARSVIVARAEGAAGDPAYLDRSYAAARADLDSLRLPLGWPRIPTSSISAAGVTTTAPLPPWYLSIPGWLITALATTVGAPFWFDMLNKIMVIRSTVKPHEKSPEEASEDRQLKTRGLDGERTRGFGNGDTGTTDTRGSGTGPAAVTIASTRRDATSVIDGCDVDLAGTGDADLTRDEDLPPAEGGVA
jgi:hypothetical protein